LKKKAGGNSGRRMLRVMPGIDVKKENQKGSVDCRCEITCVRLNAGLHVLGDTSKRKIRRGQ
jgi:hypothetical protein